MIEPNVTAQEQNCEQVKAMPLVASFRGEIDSVVDYSMSLTNDGAGQVTGDDD